MKYTNLKLERERDEHDHESRVGSCLRIGTQLSLTMLALELLGISISDATGNLGLAILIILYGSVSFVYVWRKIWQRKRQ